MTCAPAPRASSPLPSVEPLSTTITSPASPFSSSAERAWLTHSAIVSASFRHGMTTETRMASVRICLVRVCLVYDCLYPYTVGGAERWYRNLAERLPPRGRE